MPRYVMNVVTTVKAGNSGVYSKSYNKGFLTFQFFKLRLGTTNCNKYSSTGNGLS